eukprot:538615_1
MTTICFIVFGSLIISSCIYMFGNIVFMDHLSNMSVHTDDKTNNNNNHRINGKKIFIDWGANCGNSYFKMIYETRPEIKDFDLIYLFEANPLLHFVYLNDLHLSNASKIHTIQTAVWISSNSSFTFYIDKRVEFNTSISNTNWIKEWKKSKPCAWNTNTNPQGSSSIFGANARSGASIQIQSIDVTQWLLTMFGHLNCIILKVDIEGAEWKVFDKMIYDTNAACLIQEFYVEFHSAEFLHNDNLPNTEQAKRIIDQYKKHYLTKCGTPMIIHKWQ